MTIDEYFEQYIGNTIGFRFLDSNKIIDFWINNDWVIPESSDNNFYIQFIKDDIELNRKYYIIYSENLTFASLYKIYSDIIEYNLENEKKQQLFLDKSNELKEYFQELSFDELQSLMINIHPDKPTKLNKPIPASGNGIVEKAYIIKDSTNVDDNNSTSGMDISEDNCNKNNSINEEIEDPESC